MTSLPPSLSRPAFSMSASSTTNQLELKFGPDTSYSYCGSSVYTPPDNNNYLCGSEFEMHSAAASQIFDTDAGPRQMLGGANKELHHQEHHGQVHHHGHHGQQHQVQQQQQQHQGYEHQYQQMQGGSTSCMGGGHYSTIGGKQMNGVKEIKLMASGRVLTGLTIRYHVVFGG